MSWGGLSPDPAFRGSRDIHNRAVLSISPASNRHSRLQAALCSQVPHCPWACLCARMRYVFSGSEGKGLGTKPGQDIFCAAAGCIWPISKHLLIFASSPLPQIWPMPFRLRRAIFHFFTHLYLYLEPWVKISSDARRPFPPPPTRRSYLKISTQPSQIIFLHYLRIQNCSNPVA